MGARGLSERPFIPEPPNKPPVAVVRLCTRCGYDLSQSRPAIDHDVWKCPECGWLTTQVELDAAKAPNLRERRSVLLVVTVAFNTLLVAPIGFCTLGLPIGAGMLLVVSVAEAAFLHWLAWPARRLDQGLQPLAWTWVWLLGFPVVLWLGTLLLFRLI